MAYLDLDSLYARPAVAATITPPAPPAPPTFSALEWNVVALARRDTIASLSEPSRLSRALGGLFGLGAKSRLADPRLEALRRLAVHAWHHDFALPAAEVDGFLAAGFTPADVEALLASITGIRIPRRRAA